MDETATAQDYVSIAIGALASEGGELKEKASGILSAVYVLLEEDRPEDMAELAEHAQRIGRTRLARS